MIIILHIIQILFALIALGLLAGFSSSKHIGLILAAVIFSGVAGLSYYLTAWWHLGVGFVLAWGLRLLGLDPGYRRK